MTRNKHHLGFLSIHSCCCCCWLLAASAVMPWYAKNILKLISNLIYSLCLRSFVPSTASFAKLINTQVCNSINNTITYLGIVTMHFWVCQLCKDYSVLLLQQNVNNILRLMLILLLLTLKCMVTVSTPGACDRWIE